MAEDARPIIVKRIRKPAHRHHGGAWKIAYADFVTAMMAFFLLMWLAGTISSSNLKGIEEYFKTPLTVALAGGPAVGNSKSVLKGGGKDLLEEAGQTRKTDVARTVKKMDLKTAQQQVEKAELEQLEALKRKLEAAIDASVTLSQFKKQLLIDITSEGLRIQIVDELNRPMFESSRAELQPYAKQILREIGHLLNDVPNRISLSGHTDAAPYPNGEKSYSNWELSADRANASRRELVAGGMDESKLVRVVGLSSAVLFDRTNAYNPINRRISIIIMNRNAEDRALEGGGELEVTAQAPLPSAETLAN